MDVVMARSTPDGSATISETAVQVLAGSLSVLDSHNNGVLLDLDAAADAGSDSTHLRLSGAVMTPIGAGLTPGACYQVSVVPAMTPPDTQQPGRTFPPGMGVRMPITPKYMWSVTGYCPLSAPWIHDQADARDRLSMITTGNVVLADDLTVYAVPEDRSHKDPYPGGETVPAAQRGEWQPSRWYVTKPAADTPAALLAWVMSYPDDTGQESAVGHGPHVTQRQEAAGMVVSREIHRPGGPRKQVLDDLVPLTSDQLDPTTSMVDCVEPVIPADALTLVLRNGMDDVDPQGDTADWPDDLATLKALPYMGDGKIAVREAILLLDDMTLARYTGYAGYAWVDYTASGTPAADTVAGLTDWVNAGPDTSSTVLTKWQRAAAVLNRESHRSGGPRATLVSALQPIVDARPRTAQVGG